MLFSISILLVLGLISSSVFEKLRLPGLLGMLVIGVLIGPYSLNILDRDLLNISSEIRKIALIIILVRAGLGITRKKLESVGTTAIKMSIIPVLLEGVVIIFVAKWLFNFSFIEGGVLGFTIAAVSPAVVVPCMLDFMEKRLGTNKRIPTLILTSASIDDVLAITLFSTFTSIYFGSNNGLGLSLMRIPLAIILGIFFGVVIGLMLIALFKKFEIIDTKKVIYLLGSAILLTALEDALANVIPIASLIGVMCIGFVLLERRDVVAKRLAKKLGGIWVFAELFLFVLVGSEVNIDVAFHAGIKGVLLIMIGLLARFVGVYISCRKSGLNTKEKIFCMIAFSPKATVQAAIGAIPLALGMPSGEVILALAVLSIVITAPFGLIMIRFLSKRLLTYEKATLVESKLS